MHFLLIHSPLVTKETWLALVLALEGAGFEVTVISLDNAPDDGVSYHERHVDQLLKLLPQHANGTVVAVAHSGAGNILASLDPKLFEAHVFLDATFPIASASRFELFDDPNSVDVWREVAGANNGVLPRDMLVQFGQQIADDNLRSAFTRSLVEVPIALYEEEIPVHSDWPSVRHGLYVQWTDAYELDAKRALRVGFEVRSNPASHFKMLNQPDVVAETLISFGHSVQ